MRKCFWEFEKARDYVRTLGLKNKKQWKEYSRSARPYFIPSNPWITYKGEWINYQDWMGYEWHVGDNKKYYANENFFKTWTREMAYVLGFWFTDGYIYNGLARGKRTRFIFGISQCEKYILDDILKVMDCDFPIHTEHHKVGSDSYRFFIESKGIVEDIIKLGGCYRKSLVLKFPNVPKKYLPDFIRGLWDGDGSMFTGSRGACAAFSCSSKSFVDSFVEVLRSDVGIVNPVVTRDKRRKLALNIVLSPNDARRFAKYIYNDCNLFLKRKKEASDAFGDINLSTRDIKKGFCDFDVAHRFVLGLGLKKECQWREYCNSGRRPVNIPSNPGKTYKNDGWKNWKYWLTGKEK